MKMRSMVNNTFQTHWQRTILVAMQTKRISINMCSNIRTRYRALYRNMFFIKQSTKLFKYNLTNECWCFMILSNRIAYVWVSSILLLFLRRIPLSIGVLGCLISKHPRHSFSCEYHKPHTGQTSTPNCWSIYRWNGFFLFFTFQLN